MTDTPDLQQMAARYLDLWQEQVAAMSNDPAMAEMMAKTYGLIRSRWQDAAEQMKANPYDFAQPSGAAAPAVPPDGAGQQLAELTARLAAMEERLGQLEAAIRKPGKRAAPAGRKQRRKRLSKSAE